MQVDDVLDGQHPLFYPVARAVSLLRCLVVESGPESFTGHSSLLFTSVFTLFMLIPVSYNGSKA